MIHRRNGPKIAQGLVHEIGSGDRAIPEPCYTTARSEEDYRDAIMVPIPRGALPATVDGIRRVAINMPATAMVVADTLMLGSVNPAMVDPILDEIGVRRWMNRQMVPMRYGREPGSEDGDVEWARLAAADRGADLQWLIHVGGDQDAHCVAQAVGRRLGTMVTGAPVWAQHSDTRTFYNNP